jgi:hypothetical protein
MIAKPKMYDEIEVNLDFTPITVGGHKGIIMGVEEYTSELSGNTSLKVSVDTAKDDTQPQYFTEQYKNDTRSDKKWSNSAIKYVSLKQDENCVRMLKAFITSVENSNNGFTYNWDKDVDQLKGKKVGLVFGLEEYVNNDGETKTIAKLNQFRSIDKIDNIKIPKVKLIDGSFVDYEEYKNTTQLQNTATEIFGDKVVEITSEMLPF